MLQIHLNSSILYQNMPELSEALKRTPTFCGRYLPNPPGSGTLIARSLCILEPCSLLPCNPPSADPVAGIIIQGLGRRDAHQQQHRSQGDSSDIRQENPPVGTESYLCGRANLPSAARVKCAHAPARPRDEQSTMRRGRTWLDSPSRIYNPTIGQFSS